MGADVEEGGAGGLQVHPTTIETSVPLGKKVRIGIGKKRDKKTKRSSRSKSKDKKSHASDTHPQGQHRTDRAYFRRETGKTEENIAKATQLAANLSQLLFTLPPERLGRNPGYVASENVENDLTGKSKSATTSDSVEKNEGTSFQEPLPNYDSAVLIPEQSRGTKIVQKSSINTHKNNSEKDQRRHKSMNSEKKKELKVDKGGLHATEILSKSFEKLDMINHRRERAKRARNKRHGGQSDDDSETHIMEQNIKEKKSRNKDSARQHRATSKEAKDKDGVSGGKEVTIAKVGRFKFSLELNKKFDEESNQKERIRQRSKHRSKSHSRTPSKSSRKRRREKAALQSKEREHSGNVDEDEEKEDIESSRKNREDKRKRHKISTTIMEHSLVPDHKSQGLTSSSNDLKSGRRVDDENTKSVPTRRKTESHPVTSIHKAPSVIVSKQRNHDRPLFLNEKRRQRKSVPAMPLDIKSSDVTNDDPKRQAAGNSDSSDHEYEVIDICRAKFNNDNGEKFARSISHPGPPEATPEKPQIELLRGTSVCEPLSTKTNQNKGAAIRIRKQSAPVNAKKFSVDSSQTRLKDKTGKIRRSETTKEKVSTRLGVSRKESLLLLPDNSLQPSTIANRLKLNNSSTINQKPASFDNHAYDKSPEPSSSGKIFAMCLLHRFHLNIQNIFYILHFIKIILTSLIFRQSQEKTNKESK